MDFSNFKMNKLWITTNRNVEDKIKFNRNFKIERNTISKIERVM
jgi:hypothetical protein